MLCGVTDIFGLRTILYCKFDLVTETLISNNNIFVNIAITLLHLD